jgi:A/G-specific adenine glycosylase
LANLWEFPGIEGSLEKEKMQEGLSRYLHRNFGVKIIPEEEVLHYSHVFSHLQWNIHLYPCPIIGLENDIEMPREYKWVTIEEMNQFPFSVSHRKIVEYIKEKRAACD